MAAWYVLSALGLYPLCPGKPEYTLGSPLFSRATIHSGTGKSIVIDAPGNGERTPYVRLVTVNEGEHRSVVVEHDVLARGAHIRFAMRDTPASASKGTS
jgi:putative alpha-1,2-mannosidase